MEDGFIKYLNLVSDINRPGREGIEAFFRVAFYIVRTGEFIPGFEKSKFSSFGEQDIEEYYEEATKNLNSGIEPDFNDYVTKYIEANKGLKPKKSVEQLKKDFLTISVNNVQRGVKTEEEIRLEKEKKIQEENLTALENQLKKLDNDTDYRSEIADDNIQEFFDGIESSNQAHSEKGILEEKKSVYKKFFDTININIKKKKINGEDAQQLQDVVQERIDFYASMIRTTEKLEKKLLAEEDKNAKITESIEKIIGKITEINNEIVSISPFGNYGVKYIHNNMKDFDIPTLESIKENSEESLRLVENYIEKLQLLVRDIPQSDYDAYTAAYDVVANAKTVKNLLEDIISKADSLKLQKERKKQEIIEKNKKIDRMSSLLGDMIQYVTMVKKLRKTAPRNVDEAMDHLKMAQTVWETIQRDLNEALNSENDDLRLNALLLKTEYLGDKTGLQRPIIDILVERINKLRANNVENTMNSLLIEDVNINYVKTEELPWIGSQQNEQKPERPKIPLITNSVKSDLVIHLDNTQDIDTNITDSDYSEIRERVYSAASQKLKFIASTPIQSQPSSQQYVESSQQPSLLSYTPEVTFIPKQNDIIEENPFQSQSHFKIEEVDDKPQQNFDKISEKTEEITKPKLPEERRRKKIKDISEDEITEGVIYRILHPRPEFEHLYLDMIRKTVDATPRMYGVLNDTFNEAIQKVKKEEVSLSQEQIDFLNSLHNWFLNSSAKFDPVTQKVYGMIYNYLIDLFGI